VHTCGGAAVLRAGGGSPPSLAGWDRWSRAVLPAIDSGAQLRAQRRVADTLRRDLPLGRQGVHSRLGTPLTPRWWERSIPGFSRGRSLLAGRGQRGRDVGRVHSQPRRRGTAGDAGREGPARRADCDAERRWRSPDLQGAGLSHERSCSQAASLLRCSWHRGGTRELVQLLLGSGGLVVAGCEAGPCACLRRGPGCPRRTAATGRGAGLWPEAGLVCRRTCK
jgi:hypothetical protein